MKTQIKNWVMTVAKKALFLFLVAISIMTAWIAGILYVFVVPFMMLSWVVVALAWSIWGVFTFIVCQMTNPHSVFAPILQPAKA